MMYDRHMGDNNTDFNSSWHSIVAAKSRKSGQWMLCTLVNHNNLHMHRRGKVRNHNINPTFGREL